MVDKLKFIISGLNDSASEAQDLAHNIGNLIHMLKNIEAHPQLQPDAVKDMQIFLAALDLSKVQERKAIELVNALCPNAEPIHFL